MSSRTPVAGLRPCQSARRGRYDAAWRCRSPPTARSGLRRAWSSPCRGPPVTTQSRRATAAFAEARASSESSWSTSRIHRVMSTDGKATSRASSRIRWASRDSAANMRCRYRLSPSRTNGRLASSASPEATTGLSDSAPRRSASDGRCAWRTCSGRSDACTLLFPGAGEDDSRISRIGLPSHSVSGRQACPARCIALTTAAARLVAGDAPNSTSSRAKWRSMSAMAPTSHRSASKPSWFIAPRPRSTRRSLLCTRASARRGRDRDRACLATCRARKDRRHRRCGARSRSPATAGAGSDARR